MYDTISHDQLNELLIGERAMLRAGICRIKAEYCADDYTRKVVPGGMEKEPTHLTVYGEGCHPVKTIDVRNRSVQSVQKAIERAIEKEAGQL